MKIYYAALSLSEKATLDDLKKRYRELAKIYHPDKSDKNSEDEFRFLHEAYEKLYDHIKKNPVIIPDWEKIQSKKPFSDDIFKRSEHLKKAPKFWKFNK